MITRSKILILVEGAKTDVTLMNKILNMYGIAETHTVVSYNTNIYTLYREMFFEKDPSSLDLLQVLKSHENDEEKKKIFNEKYSDILLIFDLEPQDPDFSPEKIIEMSNYFIESSDMGKLYLNYPMVESFYHMKSIPDDEFYSYKASLFELKNKTYKTRVTHENRNGDYRKFATTKGEMNTVILQNIKKSHIISDRSYKNDFIPSTQSEILLNQLNTLLATQNIDVLCTCVFYISDFNPNLLSE